MDEEEDYPAYEDRVEFPLATPKPTRLGTGREEYEYSDKGDTNR